MTSTETITINIVKKNRKYFAALKGGYKCKVVIDDNSRNLTLGTHTLLVTDESVRSKYGTDLIYKLIADSAAQEAAGICTLKHPYYNSVLVGRCKDMGGRWDREQKAWVFSDLVADKIDELDDIYNSDVISIEITSIEGITAHTAPVDFCGYTISRACGRDSGAQIGDGVSLISGIIGSCGSVKNWRSYVDAGAVFRLKISEALLKISDESEHWTVRRL